MEKLEKTHIIEILDFSLRAGGQIFIGGEGDKRFGHTTQHRQGRVIRKEIGDYIIRPLFAIMYVDLGRQNGLIPEQDLDLIYLRLAIGGG